MPHTTVAQLGSTNAVSCQKRQNWGGGGVWTEQDNNGDEGRADRVQEQGWFGDGGQILASFPDLNPWHQSTQNCSSDFITAGPSRPLCTVEAYLWVSE